MLLVTGITGLTGRFLIDALRKSGYVGVIRCLIREHSDVSWMTDGKVEFVLGDVKDVPSLIRAFQGAEAVIHLVNIRSAPEVIEACKATDIKRMIIVTTTGVFSRFQQYSEEYRRLENIIIHSGLDYTIIRPTMIYGNQQDKNIHKLVKIINRFPIIPVLGKGYGMMQPIYANDLANVIAQSFINNISIGKSYNVAGKHPISLIEIMRLIAFNLGKVRFFIKIPYSLAMVAGYIGHVIPNDLINVERVKRLQEDKIFSYDAAANDLNFLPIDFGKGIEMEIAALRQAGVI